MAKKKLNRKQVKRFDPTRTGMIRRRFEAEIKRRMRLLSKEITDLLTGDVDLESVQTVNEFTFMSAADATERFRRWLRERSNSIILDIQGVQDEGGEWIGPIVETAYFKGSEQAEAAIQRARGEIAEQAPPILGGRVSQFLRAPVNVDKIKLLKGRAYEQLKGITDAMAVQLGNTLADGITRGESPRSVARTIAKEIQGVSQRRALTIARTETIRAHAEGSLDAMEQMGVTEVGVTVEWQATYINEDAGIFEERVCPRCRAMAGVILPIEQAHGMIPLHPNCVLPGHLVEGDVNKALKAIYSGEVIEITTLNGSRITVTPNHRILTTRGAIRARMLNDGDELIRYRSEGRDTIDLSVDQDPVMIEKLFESWASSGFTKTTSSAFDFDGDESSMDNEIQMVLPPLLRSDSDSSQAELDGDGEFVDSTDCSMCGRDLSLPLDGSHVGPLETLSLAPSSSNSSTLEVATNNILGQGIMTRKLEDGHSSEIILDEARRGVVFGMSGTDLSTPLPQLARYSFLAYREFLREFVNAHATVVEFDKVAGISVRHYEGPVYDLETKTGYFLADGLLICNCRCAWVPSLDEPTSKKQVEKRQDKPTMRERAKAG